MTTSTNASQGQYAPVNGIHLYYEVHGTGTPLVMLHGGFGTFEMFSAILPTLAQKHQVIGVDLYGHGRTALTERALMFEEMADDIAGLIAYLGLEQADVLGYSLGGMVALQTAIRHPERVRKLILISIPFKRTGWYPEVRQGMTQIAVEGLVGTPVHDAYVQVAPRPEDFPRFVGLVRDAVSREFDWTEGVSRLKMPTLLVVGDSDSLPPSQAAEFFSLLGGGKQDAGWDNAHMIASQLAILPSTTHYNIVYRPNLLLPVVTPFLDEM